MADAIILGVSGFFLTIIIFTVSGVLPEESHSIFGSIIGGFVGLFWMSIVFIVHSIRKEVREVSSFIGRLHIEEEERDEKGADISVSIGDGDDDSVSGPCG